MNLVASLIVKDELGRYLEPCVDSLLEFCDLVVVWDDGSEDDTIRALAGRSPKIRLHSSEQSGFFQHEGEARQRLLESTLSWEPTHVLAVDADELVTDGSAIRKACESGGGVFAVGIAEVWEATADRLCVRVDGGWRPHSINALWRVPFRLPRGFTIADRALACGRVPAPVDRGRGQFVDAEILHFGWANEAERVARHHRYAVADGGRFHRSTHLDSILWGCDRVRLEGMGWPAGLVPYRDAILAKVTSGESPSVTT